MLLNYDASKDADKDGLLTCNHKILEAHWAPVNPARTTRTRWPLICSLNLCVGAWTPKLIAEVYAVWPYCCHGCLRYYCHCQSTALRNCIVFFVIIVFTPLYTARVLTGCKSALYAGWFFAEFSKFRTNETDDLLAALIRIPSPHMVEGRPFRQRQTTERAVQSFQCNSFQCFSGVQATSQIWIGVATVGNIRSSCTSIIIGVKRYDGPLVNSVWINSTRDTLNKIQQRRLRSYLCGAGAAPVATPK